jgi:hypothetical protein
LDALDHVFAGCFRPTLRALLPFLARSPSRFVDRILRAFPVILDAVPLAFAGQLSPGSCLLFLERSAAATRRSGSHSSGC